MKRSKTQLLAFLTASLIGLFASSGVFADQKENSPAQTVELFTVLETIGQLIDSAFQFLAEAVQAETDQLAPETEPASASEPDCPDQNDSCNGEIGGQGEPWG